MYEEALEVLEPHMARPQLGAAPLLHYFRAFFCHHLGRVRGWLVERGRGWCCACSCEGLAEGGTAGARRVLCWQVERAVCLPHAPS